MNTIRTQVLSSLPPRLKSGLLGLLALFCLTPHAAHADNRSFNTSGTLDWVMLEERRPYIQGAQWSPFSSQNGVSSVEGAGFGYYTGFGNSGTGTYWHWSTWPIGNPINPGDALEISHLGPETWGHAGNGSEGTSAGMDGIPAFVTSNVWYRFAIRAWLPADGTPHQGYIGQWVRDDTNGKWYHFGTYKTPFTVKGIGGVNGFMENFTPADKAFAIDHRNCFAHKYGTATGLWQRANICYVSGNSGPDTTYGYRASLIEGDTATRIQHFGPDCVADPLGTTRESLVFNANGTTVPVTMTNQPATPPFDPIVVNNPSASMNGTQMLVKWESPATSSPQLSYQIEVFDNPGYTGSAALTFLERDPEIRQKLLTVTGVATPYVRLTITDIFDNVGTPVLITPTTMALNPATSVPGAVNGLDYKYYEAGTGVSFTTLPDFTALTPKQQGAADYVDMSLRQKRSQYAFNYTGYFMAPADGIYTFTLTSYDSSKLVMDGATLIDFDGVHQPGAKSAAVGLSAGLHTVSVQYAFSNQRGQCKWWDGAWVACEGPGITNPNPGTDATNPGLTPAKNPDNVPVPSTAWFHVPAANAPVITLVSPATGTTMSGATVPLTASVTANGATLNKVQYFVDGIYWGQSTTAPYTVNGFIGAAPGQHLRARLLYNNGFSVDSTPQSILTTTNQDVTPWQFSAIGTQHLSPSGGKVVGDTISLVGDSLNMITRTVTGDCTFIARLADITSPAALADGSSPSGSDKAGIILRASLAPDAGNPLGGNANNTRFVAAFGQVNGGTYYQDSTMRGGNGAPDRTSGNLGGANKWLKLQRTGDTFVTSISVDGVSWTQSNTVTIAGIGTTLYAGAFQFTSWNLLPYVPHASFDNVSLSGAIDGAPTVSISPSSATLLSGQSTTLATSVVGQFPFTYQWQKNGINLAGATNPTLELTNLQPADSGLYSVVVATGSGTATSSNAALTVMTSPSGSAYAAQVQSSAPIAYWRLNETGGTIADDLIGTRDGTLTNVTPGANGPRPPAASGFETNNCAVSLDGTTSYIQSPASGITGALTISAWVNPTSVSGDREIGGENGRFYLKVNGTGLRFTTPGIRDHDIAAGLVAGVWQQVAVSFTPGATSGAKFYKNGVLLGSVNASALPGGSSSFWIGKSQWAGQYFPGAIDEVAIWNRALTDTEILNQYAAAVTTPATFVQLDTPSNGSGFSAPASIGLAASIIGTGHTISKVQFYNGATLLGEDATAPYNLPWSNVPSGTYTLYAQATYDGVLTITSVPAFVTVNDPPPAPALLTATALAGNLVNVTWSASSTATSYILSRNGVPIATVGSTNYLDLGVSPGTTYSYTVVAVNPWGSSTASSAASTTTPASGGSLAWDGDTGTTGAQDGAGDWGAGSTNWWNGSSNETWTDGATAVFGAGSAIPATVTLGSNVTPGGMIFVSGTYTLADSGGNLVLSSAPVINCQADAIIAATLTGAGSLTKTGPATLTLSGTDTYSGGTVISAGTLKIGAGGTTGSITGSIANDAFLVFDRSNAQTFVGSISGNGSVSKQGPGTLSLTTANTYVGGTVINAGTLSLGTGGSENVNSLGSGSITVNNGGTLKFNPGSSGSTFTIPNAILLNGGTIRADDGIQKLSSTITIASDSFLQTVYSGKNLWISGTLAGSGNLRVDDASGSYGDGQVILSAANTGYTGTLTVNAPSSGWSGGQISISHVNALRNANLVMNTSRDIVFGAGITAPVLGSLAGTGNLTIPAVVNLSVGNNDGSSTYSGALLGTGALTKTGGGTLTLSGVNTHTGTINLNGGTLLLDGSSASTALTVGNSATFGGSGTLTGTATIQSGGSISPGGYSINTLTTGAQTWSGGGVLAWQIADWTGLSGTGSDKVSATSLNITATQANPFVIRLSEVDLTNFVQQSTSFVFFQGTSSITGFATNKFVVDSTACPTADGTWVVQQSGSNLLLTYTPPNTAPSFTANPIEGGSAASMVPFSGSIASVAIDSDSGDARSFSKTNGPAWLQIAADGTLSGTPGLGDGGANTFTVRVTDGGGLFAETSLVITVTLTPTQSWQVAQFGANAGNPTIAGDLADPDGDGLQNLIEYALGTNPNAPGSNGITLDLVNISGTDHLRLTIARNPAATDVTLTVETCADLTGWSGTTTFVETNTASQLIVRDTGSGPRRFIHLKVTR